VLDQKKSRRAVFNKVSVRWKRQSSDGRPRGRDDKELKMVRWWSPLGWDHGVGDWGRKEGGGGGRT